MAITVVANISTLPRERKERTYQIHVRSCSVQTIQAVQTNESVLKTMSHLDEIINSGGIGKIIALVSNLTRTQKSENFDNMTAWKYYRHIVEECAPGVDPIIIRTEEDDGTERAVSEIVRDVCENIKEDDIVYIDSAGGKRTIANTIQLLAKILRYRGIKNACNLYSDIQNSTNYIVDTAEFDRMMGLADAFNEFMTTGKADQLQSCVLDSSPAYQSLVRSISEFSDKIRLGQVDKLEETIGKLKQCIIDCQTYQGNVTIETVVLKQFLSVIEQRLVGNSDSVDYVKIIAWCLENMLIQQALTIFVEKIPIALFREGILFYPDIENEKKRYAEERNKLNPADWETYAFYTLLMCDMKISVQNENDEVASLKSYLSGNCDSASQNVIDASKVVECFKPDFPKPTKSNEKTEEIARWINARKFTTYNAFLNTLMNEPPKLRFLLGLQSSKDEKDKEKSQKEGDNTIAKKFEAIERTQKEGKLQGGMTSPLPVSDIVDVMYAYVYVKSLRNRINHASAEENLTEEQKGILTGRGYDFTSYTLRVIQANMIHAQKAVMHCFDTKARLAREYTDTDFEDSEQVHLGVGDIVEAYCRQPCSCRIKGINYDIQLVVPKQMDSKSLVNKVISVQIWQISNSGCITQVKMFEQDDESESW